MRTTLLSDNNPTLKTPVKKHATTSRELAFWSTRTFSKVLLFCIENLGAGMNSAPFMLCWCLCLCIHSADSSLPLTSNSFFVFLMLLCDELYFLTRPLTCSSANRKNSRIFENWLPFETHYFLVAICTLAGAQLITRQQTIWPILRHCEHTYPSFAQTTFYNSLEFTFYKQKFSSGEHRCIECWVLWEMPFPPH